MNISQSVHKNVKKIGQAFRQVKNVYKHPGSGSNVNLGRLVKQAIPYYLRKDGYSLPPLTIYLSVNGVCNFKCKMCDLGQKTMDSTFYKNLNPEKGAELKVERLIELFDEVKDSKPMIAITTTEPLMYKPLGQVVAAATERGMETLVTTNGFLLEKRAEELVNAGLKRLYVSLDGPAALHNEIRGVPTSFQKAVAGIKKIDEIKKARGIDYPVMKIAGVMSNHNYFALAELLRDIKDLPVEGCTISHMNFVTGEMSTEHNKLFGHIGYASETGMSAGTESLGVDVDALWNEIVKVKKEFPDFAHFSPDFTKPELEIFFKRPSEIIWDNRCLIPWYVAEVLTNGDMIPMTRCFSVKLGNIYKTSFKEYWNGKAIREFRKNLQKHRSFPACARCRGML